MTPFQHAIFTQRTATEDYKTVVTEAYTYLNTQPDWTIPDIAFMKKLVKVASTELPDYITALVWYKALILPHL